MYSIVRAYSRKLSEIVRFKSFFNQTFRFPTVNLQTVKLQFCFINHAHIKIFTRVLAKAGKQGGVTLLFFNPPPFFSLPPPFCMIRKYV